MPFHELFVEKNYPDFFNESIVEKECGWSGTSGIIATNKL